MSEEERPDNDKRTSSKIKYGELDPSPEGNRLSNVRWPLGQEPDAEGNNTEDGYVNVKMEVVEDTNPHIDQSNLLGGGPELPLPCMHCGQKVHVAAVAEVEVVLRAGGFTFPEGYEFPEEKVVACICPAKHVTQLRESFVKMLLRQRKD